MSNITYPPFERAHLGQMAEELRAVVFAYASRISLAEALGVLEIVKQEVLSSHAPPQD